MALDSPSTPCVLGACAMPHAPARPRLTFSDIAVLGGILVVLLYGIGDYGLYEPHEGHFAGVAREMVLTGDWVTPRLNGAPYLNKPPLFYWLIALSYSARGISEGAARLPLALIGWLGVCMAWHWARELWGARAGRVAAGILGVSAGWYLFSHQLLIDELLCLLYLTSLYFLWKALTNRERIAAWASFYVVVALSVLAKGLIGAAFPLAVLLCFAIFKRDKGALKMSRPVMGLVIVAALVIPWVALVEMRNPGFLRYVTVNEHWNRIFDKRWPPDYQVSQTSALKFLVLTLVWLVPWSLFLPQVTSFSAKNASRWSGIDRNTADAIAILGLGALLPVVLFLPVPSRLIYYSLPALPPIAVLAAGWWVVMAGPCYRRGRRLAALIALVVGGAIASLVALGALGPDGFLGQKLVRLPDLVAAPQTLDYIPSFALAIGVGLMACGALLFVRKTGAALLALCISLGAGGAYNTRGFAAFDRVRSSKRMVAELPSQARDYTWISEGSLELGAAAGTAYYLGADKDKRPRIVYVMNSNSARRRPPRFPGPPPEYLIDVQQLADLWHSNQPVLYVTDFLRNGEHPDDPPRLPPDPYYRVKLESAGHREVYANERAWKQLNGTP